MVKFALSQKKKKKVKFSELQICLHELEKQVFYICWDHIFVIG